jgi:Domain of unknown function (DUF4340)
VGLGIVAYLTRPQPARPPPERFGQILPCSVTDAVLVRVEAGGRTVEARRPRPGESWRVTQPVDAPADPVALAFFVQSMHSVSALNTLASPEAPAGYGLDAPSRVVTCQVDNGNSYTLAVGKASFDGSGYYAQRRGDSRVYVISRIPVEEFDKELAEPPIRAPDTPAGSSPRPT